MIQSVGLVLIDGYWRGGQPGGRLDCVCRQRLLLAPMHVCMCSLVYRHKQSLLAPTHVCLCVSPCNARVTRAGVRTWRRVFISRK